MDGDDLLAAERADQPIPYRCIIIYRYYDEASEDFGTGDTPPIEHFARGLDKPILRLREKVCANPANQVTPADFRVHLVAHSMGGLVCRAFLQNPALGSAPARAAVDKLYTYATPHNGIDMRIVRNVPGWLSFGDVNNFNRTRMAAYLGLPDSKDVSVVTNFPPQRIFNLVGTNARDYTAIRGASAWAAGDASDGLVRIENATTHGPGPDGRDITSPRAFVHRARPQPEPAPVLGLPRPEQERENVEDGELRLRPQGAGARLRGGRHAVPQTPLRGRLHLPRAGPGRGLAGRGRARRVEVQYGYQDINPGRPGVAAPTHPLPDGEPGIGFEIPIEQKTRPGLRGALRIEARPWS